MSDLVKELRELFDFLNGTAPLDGVWFGDWAEDRPAYWWRVSLERITRAADRIEALEKGLKPFSDTGSALDQKPKDGAVWAGQIPAPPITFGHLRAARALIEEGER